MASTPKAGRDLTNLRSLLFDTLEKLNKQSKPSPIDIDKANAISQLSGKIMDTAKLQLEYQAKSGKGSNDAFFGKQDKSEW